MSAFRIFAIVALSFAVGAPAFAKSASRTRLLTLPNPSKSGQTVKLIAEVDGLGGGASKGTVSFSDGSAALGAASLSIYGAGQTTLAAGRDHTCALTTTGGVECWGDNSKGQLGDGTTQERHAPVAVSGLPSGVVAIAAGASHTCAITSAGAAKCWGDNEYGRLGDGTTIDRHEPVSVSGLSTGVVAIATGDFHTCALDRAGGVKCWGGNASGQLGDGTTKERHAPVAVIGLSSGVVAIGAGTSYGQHSCAVTSAGAVKCWGNNWYGQLGNGTNRRNSLAPEAVSSLSAGIVAVTAGSYHTCALTSAGAVKCWGLLHDWVRLTPLAMSGLTSGIVAISAGDDHTCALTGAGAAKCFGWDGAGQLGDGKARGHYFLVPFVVSGLSSGVAAVTAGFNLTCALTSVGAVKCWGYSDKGALGDGTTTQRLLPTPVSRLKTLVRARARLLARLSGIRTHILKASFPGDALHTPSSGSRSHLIAP